MSKKPIVGGTADGEPDGFRKRRLTAAQRRRVIAEKIKSGEVRDPDAPSEPETQYGADVHVVQPPVATLDGGGTED